MTRAADRIKELVEDAKARGLTKKKMAQAIGLTQTHFSNLLTGKNEWKLPQLEKLCQVLGISLAEMFFEQGEETEVFVLLKKILDAGPEPRFAIAWNIKAIADKIAMYGPKLERRLFKIPDRKKKANS